MGVGIAIQVRPENLLPLRSDEDAAFFAVMLRLMPRRPIRPDAVGPERHVAGSKAQTSPGLIPQSSCNRTMSATTRDR